MCGIVGAGGTAALDRPGSIAALTRACDTLEHRGPDGQGVWASEDAPLALGHRRLAVLDLTDAAAQPMTLDSGHALVFNGEIYNFRALRQDLEASGERLGSDGDTEVLLRACRAWGVEATLDRSRGMFAFAYFDPADRTLWLARDRFGEKPLYYACWDGTVAFASELRALRTLPGFPTEIDDTAVELFLRHSCIGGDRSIYRVARKVRPGTVVTIALSSHVRPDDCREHVYWDAIAEAARAADTPFRGTLDAAADELDELLGDSVVASTVSDVPVGAFLSGGIDSSSVVSQLRRRTSGTVNTFTIGFGDDYRSEADAARSIARHLGTNHTELTVTAPDARDVIPRLASIYDEPFADSSQIPTFLISELARRSVTVALSGDGGDELFAGYPRYRLGESMWRWNRRTPRPLRRVLARTVGGVSDESWQKLGAGAMRTPARRWSGGLDDRAAKFTATLRADAPDDVYRLLVTSFGEGSVMRNSASPDPVRLPNGADLLHRMMLRDTTSYLPDDILTKVDRAAMAVSLETRIPLLTPEILAFSHRLPPEFLLHDDGPKRVMRQLLARHLPRSLWDGPKRGFSIPLGTWLRGPLRDWAGDLLSPQALRSSPFDPEKVSRLWEEHQTGRRDWGSRLWNLLMFQAWSAEHLPMGIQLPST